MTLEELEAMATLVFEVIAYDCFSVEGIRFSMLDVFIYITLIFIVFRVFGFYVVSPAKVRIRGEMYSKKRGVKDESIR